MNKQIKTVQWLNDELILIDQTILPNEVAYDKYNSVEAVWNAIRDMKVRGAPAIGVAAAYGVYIGIQDATESSYEEFFDELKKVSEYLATSRPTAVNLFWALERMENKAEKNEHLEIPELKELLLEEAKEIHKEDERTNAKIGEILLEVLEDGMGILTHCNAGTLATTKYGTATAPMYLAKEKGWDLKIYADETRPRLQGSMLTAFELQAAGIDVTVITDNMAAMVMSQGKIDAVIVGTDRVAANGDVANKIGTLGVSILAKNYNIPFYVAAPTSTIDIRTETGKDIPIEERDKSEVINRFGEYTAPKDSKVYNPAFDVTPFENVTAIATEKGLIRAPYEENLEKLFEF